MPSSNTFAYDQVISAHARPEAVAAEIEKLIAGTPMLVERGKWVAQDNTNIIAFLDNAVASIGCQGMPTTVILASDGIEDSEYAKLEREDARLPSPDGHSVQRLHRAADPGRRPGHAQPERDHAASHPMDALGP